MKAGVFDTHIANLEYDEVLMRNLEDTDAQYNRNEHNAPVQSEENNGMAIPVVTTTSAPIATRPLFADAALHTPVFPFSVTQPPLPILANSTSSANVIEKPKKKLRRSKLGLFV